MGLFSSNGTSRAQRRAEAKALKAKAKVDAKFASRDRRKAEKERDKAGRKAERKAERKLKKAAKHSSKSDVKVAKQQTKTAKQEAKGIAAKVKADADAKTLSPASIKRYLTVARLVSPVVVPVLYRAAVAGRGHLTAAQARRAGVSPEMLNRYSGTGAPLQARVATARDALTRVSDKGGDAKEFVAAMTHRLDNLSVAVEATETMPPRHRRRAHRAVEEELSAIDADTLARLGVRA